MPTMLQVYYSTHIPNKLCLDSEQNLLDAVMQHALRRTSLPHPNPRSGHLPLSTPLT
jgi:hypothetical protein